MLFGIVWFVRFSKISYLLFQEKARKVVVVGGGYIGMEVAAATIGWKLDTTVCVKFNLVPFMFVGLK